MPPMATVPCARVPERVSAGIKVAEAVVVEGGGASARRAAQRAQKLPRHRTHDEVRRHDVVPAGAGLQTDGVRDDSNYANDETEQRDFATRARGNGGAQRRLEEDDGGGAGGHERRNERFAVERRRGRRDDAGERNERLAARQRVRDERRDKGEQHERVKERRRRGRQVAPAQRVQVGAQQRLARRLDQVAADGDYRQLHHQRQRKDGGEGPEARRHELDGQREDARAQQHRNSHEKNAKVLQRQARAAVRQRGETHVAHQVQL